jgi:hypothetical protein
VNRVVTRPSPANVAVTLSPAATGMDAVIEPGSTTCPAASPVPRAASVLASQASELSGEPSTASPVPWPASSPLRCSWQAMPARSTPSSRAGVAPSTTPAEEALSAIVSSSPIRQSRIRESISSSAGSTTSTAAAAWPAVTPGPHSGRASTNATSGSTRGCRNLATGIGSCSGQNMSSSR